MSNDEHRMMNFVPGPFGAFLPQAFAIQHSLFDIRHLPQFAQAAACMRTEITLDTPSSSMVIP